VHIAPAPARRDRRSSGSDRLALFWYAFRIEKRTRMLNLRTLDLNLLTVFEAIYQAGSVGGAAERLSLSQSATSHALSRLREVCGDPLFIRTSAGVTPTTAAQLLYPTVQRSLVALRVGLAEMQGFDPAQSQRRFRLCNPHPLGPFHALSLRARVAAEAPQIVLSFDTRTRPEEVEDDLRDGLVDVAIDWIRLRGDSLVARPIFEERLMVVARRGHPEIGPDATLADIRKASFITLHRRRAEADRPVAVRELEALGLREDLRVSEFLEVPTVVAATDYLGLMPASVQRFLGVALGLQFLDVLTNLTPVPIYLYWHESRRKDAGHRWLREHAAASITESIAQE
jgi:DNA-binding transcriptional LysR family regulator